MTTQFAATLDAKETSSVALRKIEDLSREGIRRGFAVLSGKFTGMLASVTDPDLEEALARFTKMIESSAGNARRSIQSAHVSAGALGSVAASADLARLGVSAPRVPAPDTAYLNSVLSDLNRNVGEMLGNVREAVGAIWNAPPPPEYQMDRASAEAGRLQSVEREVARLLSNLINRSELGASAVAHRAFTDAQMGVFKAAQESNPGLSLLKTWVADLNAEKPPCALCQSLHGTWVELGEEFPHGNAEVYGGDLQGPPRHPNCRCRVVPHLVTLDEPEPSVPRLPEEHRAITAAEIRAMSPYRLRAIVAALLALISKLGRR
jgi:hypothetical protein